MPITNLFCLDPGSCFFSYFVSHLFKVLKLRCLESGEATFSPAYASSVTAPGGKTARWKKYRWPLKNGDKRQKMTCWNAAATSPLGEHKMVLIFVRQSLFSFNKSAQKLTLALKFPTHKSPSTKIFCISCGFCLKYHRENGGGPLKWYE